MEKQIKTDKHSRNYVYELDPEISASISDFMNSYPAMEKTAAGDWQALRSLGNRLYTNMNDRLPPNEHIKRQDHHLLTADGSKILLRWFSTENPTWNGPAVVFVHGGGRLFGSVDLYERIVADYTNRSNVSFLSVDYGLAPETPGKTQAEQVIGSVLWLKEHAQQFGIDENRIAIMGDSGGGGIAAGAAILARDRNIKLAKQILIYPMLDHRNVSLNEHLEPFSAFGHQELDTLWQAALGPEPLNDHDLKVTSPALLDDYEGLAPAYISIGDLDYFRNENLEYARQLALAAVPLEFHLFPGAPHGFEIFTPDTELADKAMEFHVAAIRSI